MNLINNIFFLLAAPAVAFASEDQRGLQATMNDWSVTIETVEAQGFTFKTGAGGGNNPNVKIGVTDKCRSEVTASGRNDAGQMYPSPNVDGLNIDNSGVGPSAGIVDASTLTNTVDFTFGEGISTNTLIYASSGPTAVTATVNFCVLVGLYEDVTLIDFAEVKLSYSIDLTEDVTTLTGYTVTQAEEFNGDNDLDLLFDGTLNAYFCNPTTHAILAESVDGETHQGSILSVCVKVPDGQFEIADIIELTIMDGIDTSISQSIITASAPTQSGLYATKACTDDSNTDTNICVVQFLLKANFYDFTALTLTGTGSVLLEFGGASGIRRQLRRELQVESGQEKEYQVTAQEFVVTDVEGSSANAAMTSLAAIGAIAAMVL